MFFLIHSFCFWLQGPPEPYQSLQSQNLWNWALVPVPQQVPERVQIQVQTALKVVLFELVFKLFLELDVELAPEPNSTSFGFGGCGKVLELDWLQFLFISIYILLIFF